jgi:hypothetical protein
MQLRHTAGNRRAQDYSASRHTCALHQTLLLAQRRARLGQSGVGLFGTCGSDDTFSYQRPGARCGGGGHVHFSPSLR